MPAESLSLRGSLHAPLRGLRFLMALAGARRIAVLGLLMLLASATEGLGLLLLVPITGIVAGSAVPGFDRGWLAVASGWPLWTLLAIFIALVTVRAFIVFAVRDAGRALGLSLTRQLRQLAQDATLAADWRWLTTRRSADQAALIVGEAGRVGSLANQAMQLASGAVTLAMLLASAFLLAWKVTLLIVAAGLLAALLALSLRTRKDRVADRYSEASAALQRHVTDGLTHLRAARIAGAQAELARDFTHTAEELEAIERQFFRRSDEAHLVLQVFAALLLAALAHAAIAWLEMPIALLVPVLAIFVRIVPIAGNIQQGIRSWQFCQPALDGMLDQIEQARAQAEPAAIDPAPVPLRRTIAIEAITLRFAGRERPVLRDFSHTIRAGSVVGVAGPSGSGKSTLADLLSGLIAPDSGRILIDGVLLDAEARMRWRRQVAYVEQSPYLFDDTIARNVAWGRDEEGPEAVEAALRAASAQFVFDLPDGPSTLVGERGRQLSGGERQRISLARALMRQPSLLILDEVTSALDMANEEAIARTIESLRGSCTFLILGHRPALLGIAEDIIDLGALLPDAA